MHVNESSQVVCAEYYMQHGLKQSLFKCADTVRQFNKSKLNQSGLIISEIFSDRDTEVNRFCQETLTTKQLNL